MKKKEEDRKKIKPSAVWGNVWNGGIESTYSISHGINENLLHEVFWNLHTTVQSDWLQAHAMTNFHKADW